MDGGEPNVTNGGSNVDRIGSIVDGGELNVAIGGPNMDRAGGNVNGTECPAIHNPLSAEARSRNIQP